MKRVLTVFGTRPEAIKMCPLVKAIEASPKLEGVVCVSGQHRQMLDQVLRAFGVEPDFDLHVMREGQTPLGVTQAVLAGLAPTIEKVRPDIVLVHGDTTTSFAAALAAFYAHVPVGHVEAGLRTRNLASPWPEEMNRQCVDAMASLHFAPTQAARANLLDERRDPATVIVTGNTAIDALRTTVRPDYTSDDLAWAEGSRLVLLTSHRRENQGETMRGMFRAVKRAVEEHPDVKVIFPVHPSPAVRAVAREAFEGCGRVRLVEPLDVLDFHNYLARAYLVLTDSGGIQEEAPSLGTPVLVLRDTTERPEGVEAGTLKLVGTSEQGVYEWFCRLLDDKTLHARMAHASNPYGDGHASERIVGVLEGDGTHGR